MIRLFDSFSSKIGAFEPFAEERVRIFICGPTLYDYTHLGHARIFLTYDLLCRHLNVRGYLTDVLVNMTDINKNVFDRAKSESRDYHSVAEFYAEKFVEDLDMLNVTSVSRVAFVSDYVGQTEDHISKLLDRNLAYYANGNVYLDSSKVSSYGRLSKQSCQSLLLHRLDIGPGKKSQNDIMLWNCSEDYDISRQSGFGRGIPWWHMQDTTVALENFGKNYDIHGGARELLYPHHEAHLAQYCLLSGSDNPVKTWMHVGLLLSNGKKMSKSLGNMARSRDLVERYGQNLVRLYLFSTHYRDDIEFEEGKIADKRPFLEKIFLAGLNTSYKTDTEMSALVSEFLENLDNDLDSPSALATFETICTKTIAGGKISSRDFGLICQVLGIKI